MSEQDIIINLRDAGCSEERITEFLRCRETKTVEDQVRLLRRYRGELMDALHDSQRRVDCLDFLVNRLEKQKGAR